METTVKLYSGITILLLVISLWNISCTTSTAKKATPSENITTAYNTGEFADYLYQYSIIDALLSGVYDGELTIGELRARGNLGVGGFNRMDGELYMNEGEVYKIRYDGSVHKIPDTDRVPIAFVKHFRPDTTLILTEKEMDYEKFRTRMQSVLNRNEMYAIRISGNFQKLLTRSPAPAGKPYPPLAEHLKKHQYEFMLEHTRGTGVGFYLPAYMGKVNIPGFHFHYLSEEKNSGGHILDFTANSLYVEIDRAAGFLVESPNDENFRRADLQKEREEELKKIE